MRIRLILALGRQEPRRSAEGEHHNGADERRPAVGHRALVRVVVRGSRKGAKCLVSSFEL